MTFSTHDIVPDSPTNNFCTLNPIDPTTGSPNLEDGNLTFTAGLGYVHANGTFFLESGKWYFEFHPTTELNSSNKLAQVGFREKTNINEFYYRNDGFMFDGTASTGNSTYNTSTARDVIGCYLNLDDNNGEITFYKNGSVENGSPFASNILANLTTKAFVPFIVGYSTTVYANFGQDPTFGGNKSPITTYTDANGIGAFYYPPPTGALALCTANLTDFTSDVDDDTPQEYFKAVKYTGTGGGQVDPVLVGFQPDLVWIKNRDASDYHNIYDSVRTTTEGALYTNAPDVDDGVERITFSSTGFNRSSTVYSYTNSSNTEYIAWSWKAGGAPSGSTSTTGSAKRINTSGTQDDTSCSALATAATNAGASNVITPTLMSINQAAGFSIVKYTGPGSGTSGTLPHGLGKEPQFVITKSTNTAYNWMVYHKSAGVTHRTELNGANNFVNNSTVYNGPHDANVVKYGGSSVVASGEFIAYIWAEISGYSKFGSYTGNGSPDGPFLYCGFRPAFILLKCSSDSTYHWSMQDNKRNSYNPLNTRIYANLTLEYTNADDNTDFVSNGIKVRGDGGDNINKLNSSYIFMAFAEQPFKFSNAR